MSVAVDEETFWLGDWKVEPPLNRIARGDEIVRIDPRNMKVLQLLASKPGHVFSQTQIEEQIWSQVFVTPNSVYQSIAQLRRAMGDGKANPRYIETIARRGYRIIAHVKRVNPESSQKDEKSAPIRRQISRSGLAITVLLGSSVLAAVSFTSMRQGFISDVPQHVERSTSSTGLGEPLILGEVPKTASLEPSLLQELAEAAVAQGKPREAQTYLLKALHLNRSRVGDRHPIVGELLTDLSNVYVWQSDYAAAESAARNALDAFQSTPESHPDHIAATRQLGNVLMESGDYAGAEEHLNRALKLSTQVFGWRSRSRSDMLILVSALRYNQRRLDEAEQLALEAISIAEELSVDPHTLGHDKSLLALILLAQFRYQDAKQLAENVLHTFGGDVRPDHPYVVAVRDILGKALIGLRDSKTAEVIFRENIKLWQQNDGWSRRASASASALGEALLDQGFIDEAEVYLSRASLEIDSMVEGRAEEQQFREHQDRLKKLEHAKANLSERRPSTVDDR